MGLCLAPGQGRPGVWLVERDDATHGNVLTQTDADTTNSCCLVAVIDGFTAKDVDASVQFKAVSGKVDQGAGLICHVVKGSRQSRTLDEGGFRDLLRRVLGRQQVEAPARF